MPGKRLLLSKKKDFVDDDSHKTILIEGAGPSGLSTLIAGFSSKSEVTLTTAAPIDILSAKINWRSKVADLKMEAGKRTLISSIPIFELGDVGEVIIIKAAGLPPLPLLATIAKVSTDLDEVELTAAASTSVVDATFWWGTDDSVAIEKVVNAAYASIGGSTVCFVPGTYLLTKKLLIHSNVTLSFINRAAICVTNDIKLSIMGSILSSPNQIFDGPGFVVFESGLVPRAYPQWWGAYSNGSTTMAKQTTTAIQAAANAVHNPINPSMSQVIEFLPGEYVINDEIALGAYANTISGSGALIQMIYPTEKKIFNFWNAYMLQVSGLQFGGGGTQIAISNPNINRSMFHIENCVFDSAKEYAIVTTPTPPAKDPNDHLSAILTIDNCKFINSKAVLNNRCDIASVNNCWVDVSSTNTPTPTAIFINGYPESNYNSRLYLHNMYGVQNFPLDSNCRWIDNYGSVSVDNSRFGGENTGGISIIYHYAKHHNRDGRWPRFANSVVIRDSWVFTGYDREEGEHTVLSLRTDVPTVFIYEGNFGPAGGPFNPPSFWGNPLIRDGGVKPDLGTYIKSFPPNYFRFVIEPNEMTVNNIPEPLRPLINHFERMACLDKFGKSIPTAGVWERGQRLWNSEPKSGGILGWICVNSGHPGDWKEFGIIT